MESFNRLAYCTADFADEFLARGFRSVSPFPRIGERLNERIGCLAMLVSVRHEIVALGVEGRVCRDESHYIVWDFAHLFQVIAADEGAVR